MNRSLTWVNALGVAILAVLCVAQWQANRQLNRQRLAAERLAGGRSERIGELEQTLREKQQDLAGFKTQLDVLRRDVVTDDAPRRERELELPRLRLSLTNWIAAVAAREVLLKEAQRQQDQLVAERNRLAADLNSVSLRHNRVVEELNQRTRDFNQLRERLPAAEPPPAPPKP